MIASLEPLSAAGMVLASFAVTVALLERGRARPLAAIAAALLALAAAATLSIREELAIVALYGCVVAQTRGSARIPAIAGILLPVIVLLLDKGVGLAAGAFAVANARSLPAAAAAFGAASLTLAFTGAEGLGRVPILAAMVASAWVLGRAAAPARLVPRGAAAGRLLAWGPAVGLLLLLLLGSRLGLLQGGILIGTAAAAAAMVAGVAAAALALGALLLLGSAAPARGTSTALFGLALMALPFASAGASLAIALPSLACAAGVGAARAGIVAFRTMRPTRG